MDFSKDSDLPKNAEGKRDVDSHNGQPDFFEAIPAVVSSVLPREKYHFSPSQRFTKKTGRPKFRPATKFSVRRKSEEKNAGPERQKPHFLDQFPDPS